MTNVDDVVTGFGPWHYCIVVFVLLRGFPSAYFAMSPTFMAPTLDHWCARPNSLTNWTTEQWKTYGIPQEAGGDGALTPKHCMMHPLAEENGNEVSNASTIACSSWEYDLEDNAHYLTNQFNLVCNRVWLRAASQSFYMAGNLIGCLISCHVSDWYGRKTAMGFLIPLPLVAGLIMSFSTSFLMYNIGRMAASFAMGGIWNASYTLITECVEAKHRAIASFVASVGWTTGLLILVGFAWYLRNWVHLQIAISLSMLVTGALWLTIPESPRWLLSVGRYERARAILENAIRLNEVQGTTVDSIIDKYKRNEEQENVRQKLTIAHLFKPIQLCRITVTICMISTGCAMLYYNATYSSIKLGDNPYLSFAIVAAMEYPSLLAVIPIIKYVRRRTAYVLAFGISAICSAGIILVPKELWVLQLCLATASKVGIDSGWAVNGVQVSELYPTRMRTLAVGFAATVSRIGAILSPFTNELGALLYSWVPRALDCAICIIIILLCLSLPETFNVELPDTLADIKLRIRGTNNPPPETENLRK